MKPKTYDEKYAGDIELAVKFKNRLQDLKNEIKVQLPCKVHSVDYENNQVSVEVLDYDADAYGNLVNYPIVPNIPIRIPTYSGNAYMVLPVQIGDIGTIEFFDSSVKDLITTGNYDYDYSEEWHSLNNGLFTNGFLPRNKVFPIDVNSKITLATSNGAFVFKVNSSDELEVLAPKITINSETNINGQVNITGNVNVDGDITSTGTITGQTDVIANGKSGSTHTHTDSMSGTTSPPN